MLADPTLPLRNLATLLNEHALSGEQVISHPKVGNIREAFVEQINKLAAKQLHYPFSRACAEKFVYRNYPCPRWSRHENAQLYRYAGEFRRLHSAVKCSQVVTTEAFQNSETLSSNPWFGCLGM